MTGFFAVVKREVVERRMVLVAAAVAGLLPLAIAILPWPRTLDPDQMRGVLAVTLAVAFASGLAILLGATMIGRDLSERRMGFHFSRPLSAGAIWGGKLVAALILVHLVLALALLPTAIVDGGAEFGRFAGSLDVAIPAAIAVTALLVVLASHATSVAIRSRSPLIAIDALVVAAAGAAVWWSLRSLAAAAALDVTPAVAAALVAALAITLLGAGYAQVAHGRTDLARGHRAQSVALWTGMALTAIVLGGYAAWFLSPHPRDLRGFVETTSSPDGAWIAVSGTARGRGHTYTPAFLVDPSSGSFVRIDLSRWFWSGGLVFSADGRRAVWTVPSGGPRDPGFELVSAELTSPRPVARLTGITFRNGSLLALSPDGERVAVRDADTLSVVDLDGGRVRAAVRTPELARQFARAAFVDPDHVRVVGQSEPRPGAGSDMGVFDLEISTRRFAELWRIGGAGRHPLASLRFDPTGSRALVRRGGAEQRSLQLVDAATGALLREVLAWSGNTFAHAAFLADGRIVLARIGPPRAALHIFSRDGTPEQVVDLGPGGRVLIGDQPAPESLVVAVDRSGDGDASAAGRWRGALIDLASGQARDLEQSLVPVTRWWWRDLVARGPVPGSPASRLLLGPWGSVKEIDPKTGTLRPVRAFE